MEVAEKQCSGCHNVKPILAYGFVKKTGSYKAKCKDCIKAVINALRYGTASELYKEKERVRNAGRVGYVRQWQDAHPERIKEINQESRIKAKAKRAPFCCVYFNTCLITGQVFACSRKGKIYSKEGVRINGLVRMREAAKAAHEVKKAALVCKQCDTPFAPVYGSMMRTYCSSKCRFRAAKAAHPSTHRKRARYFGVAYEPVNPITVFARDGWKCRLCGIATPKSLRGTCEPNAPELDHVMPLSKGGPHAYDNVQCACRSCNGAKGEMLPHLFALTRGAGKIVNLPPLW